uniref:Uncharacterized protein n=1 Tax=Populus davidiana TaxID=266767 RepID=A0A6M2EYY5_9ROSI
MDPISENHFLFLLSNTKICHKTKYPLNLLSWVFGSASLSSSSDLLPSRSALLWVFFVFPSASGSWQEEEGWLLICRCRCVRAAAGDCWVCGRCRREEAGRRPVAEDEWLQKMKKRVSPALPCVSRWLTGEDGAAAAGGENRPREM